MEEVGKARFLYGPQAMEADIQTPATAMVTPIVFLPFQYPALLKVVTNLGI